MHSRQTALLVAPVCLSRRLFPQHRAPVAVVGAFDKSRPDVYDWHKQVSIESGHRVDWVVERNYKFTLSAAAESLAKWLGDGAGMCPPVMAQASLYHQ